MLSRLVVNVRKFAIRLLSKTTLSKSCKCEVESLPVYSFQKEDVEPVFYSTNNMLKINGGGYFRFCRKHHSKSAFNKESESLFAAFADRLKGRHSQNISCEQFVAKELDYWKMHNRKCDFQMFNANRLLAETKMAELLGLEDLLTKVEFVNLRIEGLPDMLGTMMSNADGVDVREIKDCYKTAITPQLARALNNLNILDVICYEQDHRPGNYKVVLNSEGKAVSIQSFDNDSPWAFSPFGKVNFHTYERASYIINNGKINRPAIDKQLAEKIVGFTKNDISQEFSQYLNKLQLRALWNRINALQIALNNSKEIWLEEAEWTEDLMQSELSGKWGRTYIVILYH